ncbi:cytidine deaminase [bacterium]|nr:cytidine deaminase [bacterium]
MKIIDSRPSKDEVYMRMAKEVARRSTCLSRRTGSVLLSADYHVIATGYNGAPSGMPHQTECQRLRIQTKSGAALDTCNDVHAEENAIIQAALNGSSTKGGTLYTVKSPCHRCARMIVNAGITSVVYMSEYGDTRAFEMFETAGVSFRSSESV